MNTEAIQRAREIVGGTVALAKALGLSVPTVSEWMVGKRRVPLERCPTIESLTGNQVSRKDLRPDVDWASLGEAASGQQAAEYDGPDRRRQQMRG